MGYHTPHPSGEAGAYRYRQRMVLRSVIASPAAGVSERIRSGHRDRSGLSARSRQTLWWAYQRVRASAP